MATDIRIVLNRINTFRDEVFGDPNVLRSYFYAISDLAIGGRSADTLASCLARAGAGGPKGDLGVPRPPPVSQRFVLHCPQRNDIFLLSMGIWDERLVIISWFCVKKLHI